LPGDYSVTLTVNGKSYTQSLTLKMDPRVKASHEDLVKQFEALKKLSHNRQALEGINKQLEPLMSQIDKVKDAAEKNPVAAQLDELVKKLHELSGLNRARIGAPLELEVLGHLKGLFNAVERADVAPTPAIQAGVDEVDRAAPRIIEQWRAIETHELPELNNQLRAAGLPQLTLIASASSG